MFEKNKKIYLLQNTKDIAQKFSSTFDLTNQKPVLKYLCKVKRFSKVKTTKQKKGQVAYDLSFLLIDKEIKYGITFY